MTTTDINGRPYAKLSKLKAGDALIANGGFTCMRDGSERVVEDEGEYLFVRCAKGKHALDGQADDGEHLIGLYRKGDLS